MQGLTRAGNNVIDGSHHRHRDSPRSGRCQKATWLLDAPFHRLQRPRARPVAIAPACSPHVHGTPAQRPPGSPPPAPPRRSGASQSAPTPPVRPATKYGLRSDRKAIGGYVSTRVHSSTCGASGSNQHRFVNPRAKDAPVAKFLASLGLYPSVGWHHVADYGAKAIGLKSSLSIFGTRKRIARYRVGFGTARNSG